MSAPLDDLDECNRNITFQAVWGDSGDQENIIGLNALVVCPSRDLSLRDTMVFLFCVKILGTDSSCK